MSKPGSGPLNGLIGGERAGRKPPHPNAGRWIQALVNWAVLVIALTSEAVLSWLVTISPAVAKYLGQHERTATILLDGVDYLAAGLLVIVLLGLLRTVWFWKRWGTQISTTEGQYWAVIAPQPKGGRETSTNTNPGTPHIFWDRVASMLSQAGRRKQGLVSPYMVAELWGKPGGRVQWGWWLPHMVQAERATLRQLITADRPQARLVQQPDPMLAALERADTDPSDDGVRWYAGALLSLAIPDYYPLLSDGLAISSVVSALRPPSDVRASSLSLIISPAPEFWGDRIDRLVQRRRWISRYERRFDDQYKQEADLIGVKSQESHVVAALRVHVIARSQAAAERELQQIVTAVTASRKRYKRVLNPWQHWKMVEHTIVEIHRPEDLPTWSRIRAPFRPVPKLFPFFPLS
jgi:hypothetical protein